MSPQRGYERDKAGKGKKKTALQGIELRLPIGPDLFNTLTEILRFSPNATMCANVRRTLDHTKFRNTYILTSTPRQRC